MRLNTELLQWLQHETPYEKLGREMFARHGQDYTQQDMHVQLQTVSLPVETAYQEFSALDIHHHQDGAATDPDFVESNLFEQGRDVSIYKHPRYSPLFLHAHRFIEMTWVLSGSCKQWLDSMQQERCVELKEGDLLILPPGAKHAVGVFDASILINILIRKSTFNKFFLSMIPANSALSGFFANVLYSERETGAVVFRTANDEGIKAILLEAMLEICRNEPFSNEVVNLQIGLLLTRLMRSHAGSASFPGQDAKGLDYLPAMINYMQANYMGTSLEDLSHQFHFSTSYISRLFQEHAAASFTDILRRIRMQAASDLLCRTSKPVGDIAIAVGYSDVTHFIRTFKKQYGTTPKQFRMKNLQDDERV